MNIFLCIVLVQSEEYIKENLGLRDITINHSYWETTTTRRIAVRETGVSWQNGGRIKVFLKPLRSSQHYRIEGLKEGSALGHHYAERRQPLEQSM